jgi:hemolysin activation/secretion protein
MRRVVQNMYTDICNCYVNYGYVTSTFMRRVVQNIYTDICNCYVNYGYVTSTFMRRVFPMLQRCNQYTL